MILVRASYPGHFAEVDDWEQLESVRGMEADIRAAGRDVTIHLHPEAGHSLFEDDRPEHYHAQSAAVTWDRTLHFLRGRRASHGDE